MAPGKGEPHEKEFNGNAYIYCLHHGDLQWVLKINKKGKSHAENCAPRKKAGAPVVGNVQTRKEAHQAALAGLVDNDDLESVDGAPAAKGTPRKI